MALCLILGGGVESRFICDIPVEMWTSKKISHLREKIKEGASLSTPAQNLKLWKVAIPIKDENDKKTKILINKAHESIDIKEELGGELLDAEDSICSKIDKVPANNHVHIIVQLPQSAAGRIHIFVDISNLYVQGKKNVAIFEDLGTDVDKKGEFIFEELKIDYGRILEIALDNREVGGMSYLIGSRPPSYDSLWKFAKRNEFNVKVIENSIHADIEITRAMTKTVVTNDPGILILVSGNKDLRLLWSQIREALEKNWKVEIWSWTISDRRIRNLLSKGSGDLLECTRFRFLEDYYRLFSYGNGLDLTGTMRFIDVSNGDMFDNQKVINWFIKIGLFCWLNRKGKSLRLYFKSNQDLYKAKNWIIKNHKEVQFRKSKFQESSVRQD